MTNQYRLIKVEQVKKTVTDLVKEVNTKLDPLMLETLKLALPNEVSDTGRDILEQLIRNFELARDRQFPYCQDTGASVVFLEIGERVTFDQEGLLEAINQAVAVGYQEGYLRKSIVRDPLENRVNTGSNTPAMIHTEIVPGNEFKISVMAKGGGCENMSTFKSLPPSAGVEGLKKFVLDTVINSGGNPCPPIFLGIGIGGDFEKCAILAKKSLFREIGERNPNPFYANLEAEILELVNKSGVGPMGIGGRTTCLDVFVETFPCHIASLPVAINVECHAHRAKTVELEGELIRDYPLQKTEYVSESDPGQDVIEQIRSLVDSGKPRDEILLQSAELLRNSFPKYNWVGFYLVDGEELVLGPYVGKPSPHTRISFDSGICGAAAREQKTVIVNDVNQDSCYLACSLETKSEIVVPIWKEGRIVGEIDIDSDELTAFNDHDRGLLEQITAILSQVF
jgi:fumarate hydratase subunit alpha